MPSALVHPSWKHFLETAIPMFWRVGSRRGIRRNQPTGSQRWPVLLNRFGRKGADNLLLKGISPVRYAGQPALPNSLPRETGKGDLATSVPWGSMERYCPSKRYLHLDTNLTRAVY